MRTALFLSLASALAFSQPAPHCVVISEGAPPLPAKLLEGQGRIHFPISTKSPDAQKFFEQGVAQMHSFWAREAERSFLHAAQLDPEAPMPWWGVAMVASGDFRPHFQLVRDKHLPGTLPSTPNGKRALSAAKRAVELSGNATPLEKLFIDSIWARRNPESKDQDADYIAGLRKIVAAHPKDLEARTYLALHLMDGFVLPDHKPRPGSIEAVEILRAVVKDAPEHPGGHHYVIHGWEGSSFAKDAWDSCKRYAELVPNIPHALHMPGHIYAQTGKLKEAQNSFITAAHLERKYMAEDKDYGNGHHGHNVHFLTVALTADGQSDRAVSFAKELLGFTETEKEKKTPDAYRTAYRQGYFSMVRSLVWAERWDDVLAGKLIPELTTPREKFWRHWARSLAFSAKKDTAAAAAEISLMREVQLGFDKIVKQSPPREFEVALMEADSFLKIAKGDAKRGLKGLKLASEAERALRYNEPPIYPRPIAEAWGLAAQRSGDRRQAERAFRIALDQFPESRASVDGLKSVLSKRSEPTPAGGGN